MAAVPHTNTAHNGTDQHSRCIHLAVPIVIEYGWCFWCGQQQASLFRVSGCMCPCLLGCQLGVLQLQHPGVLGTHPAGPVHLTCTHGRGGGRTQACLCVRLRVVCWQVCPHPTPPHPLLPTIHRSNRCSLHKYCLLGWAAFDIGSCNISKLHVCWWCSLMLMVTACVMLSVAAEVQPCQHPHLLLHRQMTQQPGFPNMHHQSCSASCSCKHCWLTVTMTTLPRPVTCICYQLCSELSPVTCMRAAQNKCRSACSK